VRHKPPESFEGNQLVIPCAPESLRIVAYDAGLFSRRVQLGGQPLLDLASPEALSEITYRAFHGRIDTNTDSNRRTLANLLGHGHQGLLSANHVESLDGHAVALRSLT
jgi:hypothetical protein